MFGLLLGTVLGIIIMILAALEKGSSILVEETMLPEETNLNSRTLPFIQIHQKSRSETEEVNCEGEVNRLKDKWESFKLRNRFYQS